MFSDINAEIIEIQGELRKKDKYQKQLADYERELEVIEKTLSQLRVTFEAEKEDVEKLEGLSLTNLFALLSGTKDEKLAKEKEEMIAERHKLEEAAKTKMEIEDAMLGIRNKLYNLKDTEYKFHRLLMQKENMVKTSSSPFAARVLELSEQEGNLKAYMTELDEAITAGERVESALIQAMESLKKAENWGTWDMFGGGTITGVVKHQHIDQSEAYLHQAQTSMRQFQKELLDVQEQANLEINISGMLKFADFFFDGFIADYMVQGKITGSLDQTRSHYDKVYDLLKKLRAQLEEEETELGNIQKEKQEIIAKL
ncbi:hypothetical protein [Ferdinandcohnia sp. Marseille-Q9671]